MKLPECVIFIGIPATGKSTLYKKLFFRSHVRINLDMLRTRHREKLLFNACLDGSQSMVIDNTNVTRATRKRYIDPLLNTDFVIKGYYFQSIIADAVQRNQQRPEADKIPDKGVMGMAGQLEIPTLDEGFHQLYYVSITSDNQFSIEEWNNDQ